MNNDDDDEHIGKHQLAENDDAKQPPAEKPKGRYVSKFPGNLPPSWSTFNNKTTAHPGV